MQINRDKLVREIRTAFRNVRIGEGIGIYEAEALDDYAVEDQRLAARFKDRVAWESWGEIPAEVVSKCYSVLCFVDPEGMRFLLPAFMVFTVENYDKSNSSSIDSVIYALDLTKEAFAAFDAVLSAEQKEAVAKFLRFMVVEAGENWVDAVAASRAYEAHWSQYESEA